MLPGQRVREGLRGRRGKERRQDEKNVKTGGKRGGGFFIVSGTPAEVLI